MAIATYNDAGDTYEDTDFLWDGLDPALAMSVLVGTSAAAADLTGDIKWDTFVATDNGSTGRSLISFRIEAALSALTTVTDQALVKVVNHTLHTETHRALIRSRKPIGRPLYDAVEIIADDLGSLLDDTFIALEIRPAETMQARLIALWAAYRPNLLDNDTSLIASIGSTLEAQTFAGVTLRQAIESTLSQASASADYFIDGIGRLRVFTASGLTAPFNIDNDAPGGGEVAADRLDIEYDTNSFVERVYVQGGTPEGSGYYPAEGRVRTKVIQAPDCTTAAMATALASMYLGRVDSGIARGSFEITGVDGWQAGQMVLITDAAKGLSAASFRIHKVTTRVARPGPTAATLVFRYTVEFGGSQAGGGQGVPTDTLGSGQLVYGNLGGQSNTYITADGVIVTDGL
jgi:hypothetical protein